MLTGKEFIEYIRKVNAFTEIDAEARRLIDSVSIENTGGRKETHFLHTILWTKNLRMKGYKLFHVEIDIYPKCDQHAGRAEIIGAREICTPEDIDKFFQPGMETFDVAEAMKKFIYENNAKST